MRKRLIAVGHAITRIFNATFARESTRDSWMRWRY